jgi:phage shock protein A
MANLFEKINTLISASLHSLVDRALEANSPKVLEEYIRQVERNLEELEESTANVGGTVKTLRRKYEEFNAAADKLDNDIDQLIIAGKDDLAIAAQAQLNTKRGLAAEYLKQWEEQNAQYELMLGMRAKLQTRLVTIKQEREHLLGLLQLMESKKIAAKTMKSLDQIATIGDEQISSLSESIRARLDREDARLEQATRNIADQIDDAVRSTELERQLEERRKRLLNNQ